MEIAPDGCIARLPSDVIDIVLSLVDASTLARLCCVSRLLRSLAGEPAHWRGLVAEAASANIGWHVTAVQLAMLGKHRAAALLADAAWCPPRPYLSGTLAHWPPALARVVPSESWFTIDDDGCTLALAANARRGIDRVVRCEPALPTAPYTCLRAKRVPEVARRTNLRQLRAGADRSTQCFPQFEVELEALAGYFEVTVGSPPEGSAVGPLDCITVGLASAAFPLTGKQPGWDGSSFGFHSDDGHLFHGSGQHMYSTARRWSVGDVVGCGISLLSHKARRGSRKGDGAGRCGAGLCALPLPARRRSSSL
jgi:hypothetical protein